MKSYTLGNWDGSLTNGTSSARDAGSRVRHDVHAVQTPATPKGQNRASIADGWQIPVQDTHYRYPGGPGATDGHDGAKSRMNGIQLGDASPKDSAKSRRVVNGYTTYKRNDGPSSAQIKTKLPPSSPSNVRRTRLGIVLNSTPTLAPSRNFLPQTPPPTHVLRSGQPLRETTGQNYRATDDESLAMDVDDTSSLSALSSVDAEGDEDDDDVSFVNDMLINAEPSSKSPTTISSDHLEPPPSPLSPLFTPPASVAIHFNTASENISNKSPSNQRIPVDLFTPPPDGVRAPSISTKGSRKQGVGATAELGGKKRKRTVISHIVVPPLPASVSRESYRTISSLPLKTQSKLMSRPAKILAQIRVQKTLVDGLRVATQHNLNLGPVDDWRDATYTPSAISKKNVGSGSSKVSPRETGATKKRTRTVTNRIKESSAAIPEPNAETNVTRAPTPPTNVRTPTPTNARAPTPTNARAPTPPTDAHASTPLTNAHAPTPLTNARAPTPPTSAGAPTSPANAGHAVQISTPKPLLPASPPSITQIPLPLPLSYPLGSGEKRKYKKRPKGEEREVGAGNSQSKKTKVVRIDKGKEPIIDVDVVQPKERPKKHRRPSIAYSRYNPEQGVLRIFFHGVPTTCHSVLEMNVRHIRSKKGVSEEDDSQSVDLRLEVTQGHEIPSWFIWPPVVLDTTEEEEYYLGGMLEELVDEEENRLESQMDKVKRERCSSSHTLISDEPFSIQVEHEAVPPSLLHSPMILPDNDERLEEAFAHQTFSQPSAKALGKRKALDLHVKSPSATLQRSGSQDLGRVESDGESILHMEQFLQDPGPSPSSFLQLLQPSASGIYNMPNLPIASAHHLSAPRHHGSYDPDTLSRALISADNDPFISSASGAAGHDADSFLALDSGNATVGPWPEASSLSGNMYKGFDETTNETINPQLLGSPVGISTPDAHYLVRQVQSPTGEDMSFFQSSPFFSLSASIGRRLSKVRRPSDMVDITDLDLGSSVESSDGEMDAEDEGDKVYVPSVSVAKQVNQDSQRKGPRIVTAKELARIQKRKALERERERERLEKERALAVASATMSGTKTIGHPRSKFPCGTDHSFCHQCRRRTYYLKMKCACRKLYCCRCVSTRYDNLSFDESKLEWTCPACHNSCTCDACTRKRGEVYIPLRPPRFKIDEGEEMIATRSRTVKTDKVRVGSSEPEIEIEGDGPTGWTSSSEEEVEISPSGDDQAKVIRVSKPFPPTRIVGVPGSYWGNVYSLTGEKVGTASVGEDNQTVKLDCSLSALMLSPKVVSRRKRVFAGRRQPCWGKAITETEVPDGEDAEMVKRLSRWKNTDKQRRVTVKKRFYIGDPELFLKRVVIPTSQVKEDGGNNTPGAVSDAGPAERAHFAYSLSPLSSLSSLPSDSEAEKDETKNNAENGKVDGLQLDLGLESQSSKVEKTKAKKKREASRDKAAGFNDDNDIDKSLGKQDGVHRLENNAVKDGHKVEMEERMKAEKDGKEQKHGARARSASFSPDSLGDSDVARAILLSFSACSMPVNA